MTHRIKIRTDGQIEWLGKLPIDLPLDGTPTKRRVSTILPVNPVKRAFFRLIRQVAGDDGRPAAWTRTWAGPWRATILATGQSAVFDNRQAAIDWEYEILNSPKFEL